jgi:hypothetical protein
MSSPLEQEFLTLQEHMSSTLEQELLPLIGVPAPGVNSCAPEE